MTFKEIKNNPDDLIILKKFINNLGDSSGDSSKYFKYFNRRDVSVIQQHVLTVLILDDNENPISYGHLDFDEGILWLGICVLDSLVGMGYGRYIMDYLIKYADRENIKEITLKVNTQNILALSLFKKYGFKIVDTSGVYHTMKKNYIEI